MGFPRLVTTPRRTYLVLDNPKTGEAGLCDVLRLDGEPTTSLDLCLVLTTLLNESIELLEVPWRDF